MPAQCGKGETVTSKDRPQHTGPCWRTPSQQKTAAERDTADPAVELPLAMFPSNFIYTTFAYLLQIGFRWTSASMPSHAATNDELCRLQPPTQQRNTDVQRAQHAVKHPHNHEPEPPTQDWRLQMLMERRRREAERAQHNPHVVVTFSGPTRVGVNEFSVANHAPEPLKRVCAANLSEDEDSCQPQQLLPFTSSGPVSRCGSVTPVSDERLSYDKNSRLIGVN
ncbi:hypothetical protein B0H12DRAFT_1066305 [Mycena haematopus]|nr:hypothetical protein B0H12DRAFT_1066305 [Mycena haematopus]